MSGIIWERIISLSGQNLGVWVTGHLAWKKAVKNSIVMELVCLTDEKERELWRLVTYLSFLLDHNLAFVRVDIERERSDEEDGGILVVHQLDKRCTKIVNQICW